MAPDPQPTPRWRRAVGRVPAVVVRCATGAGVTMAVEVLARTGTGLLTAAVYGLILGSGYHVWRLLVPRLGRLTALAALCLASAGAFGLIGLAITGVSGVCGGCVAGPTVGSLMLAGVAVPLLVATVVAPVRLAAAATRQHLWPRVRHLLEQARRS